MDNLIYHAGIMLRRFIEGSGRQPTAAHYLVAALLQARDERIDLDGMVHILILANEYDPKKNKLDQDEIIRRLIGY